MRLRSRAWIAAAVVAVLAIALANFALTAPPASATYSRGLVLLLASAIMFLMAFVLWSPPGQLPPALPDPPRTVPETPLRWPHRLIIAAGVALLLVAAESNSNLLGLKHLVLMREHTQLIVFGLGCALLVFGFRGRVLDQPAALPARTRRLELAALLALTVIGLALRLIYLETVLPVYVDAASFTEIIVVLDWHGSDPVYMFQSINTVASFPRLYAYFQWIATELFGHHLWAVRLPTVIIGALSVPALYFAAKTFFNRQTAFIAAGLIATMPFFLHFSRVVLNNIADPTVGIVAFAFFMRGVQRGGRANFALAGVALGWTQYFHEAGRLTLPAIMLAWWAFMFVVSWGRAAPRRVLAGMAITAFCALIIAVPTYATRYANNVPFASRFSEIGLKPDYWSQFATVNELVDAVSLRFTNNLTAILYSSRETIYHPGSEPFLMLPVALAAAAGVGLLLRFWRQPSASLLALWMAVPLAGVSVFMPELQSPRVLPSIPAALLTAAVGLDALARLLTWGRVRGALLLAGVTALCSVQAILYFARYEPAYYEAQVNFTPWTTFTLELEKLPTGAQLHIVTDSRIDSNYVGKLVRFTTKQTVTASFLAPADVTDTYLAALDRSRPQVFIWQQSDPNRAALALALRDPFVTGTPLPAPHYAPVTFMRYDIPPLLDGAPGMVMAQP